MKSSTIRRSTLSKETMEVIENLSKEQDPSALPGEYVRPEDVEVHSAESTVANKAQEIDLLWQNFKNLQFNTKSPMAYVSLGFVSGVVTTLIILTCLGVFVAKSDVKVNLPDKSVSKLEKLNVFNKKVEKKTIEQEAVDAQKDMNKKVSVPNEGDNLSDNSGEMKPFENSSFSKTKGYKTYIVKSGDTGESIVKHYYGTYSPDKAELVRKASGLPNLDKINIGQELRIPIPAGE